VKDAELISVKRPGKELDKWKDGETREKGDRGKLSMGSGVRTRARKAPEKGPPSIFAADPREAEMKKK